MSQSDSNVQDKVEDKIDVNEPKKCNVILHNDDVSTFEFVMYVLQQIFHKTPEEAIDITLHVHENGRAVVGTYTKEIAEEKTNEVIATARANNFPLVASYEET